MLCLLLPCLRWSVPLLGIQGCNFKRIELLCLCLLLLSSFNTCPCSIFSHLWKVNKVSSLLQDFHTWPSRVLSQIAGCKGIEYSSPTLASAISNLTAAFTFTLAVIFRMEKVVLRSSTSQAKIIGAILSISGALVIVLYKGPKVLSAISLQQNLTSLDSSWIIGGLLLASQYFLISVWYIIQTRVMEAYPEEIAVVFFYNLFATLISAPVCLFAETNLASWVLKPDICLAAIIYSGVFVSLFSALTHTWGLHLKGPVYISLFRPLSIAIAVAMGAIFLGDPLHLGSVIGSMILCFGFYTVIWGKAREDATKTVAGSEHYSPLLPTHTLEDEALPLR